MNRLHLSLIGSVSTLLLLTVPALPMPTFRASQLTTSLTLEQLRQVAQSFAVKVFAKNSTASGILIAKQGHVYTVLTNKHVTAPGQPYRIQTPDGQIYQATQQPVAFLQKNDLALLQFRATRNYVVAKLGVSSPLTINTEVVAAGFPFEGKGLVLTTGRIALLPNQALLGGYRIGYTNAIQQGMSGGPLLNRQGEVIGINGLAAYPILNHAYQFQDGSLSTVAQQQQIRRLSWGVPVQTFAQLAALPSSNLQPQVANSQSTSLTAAIGEVNKIAAQITVRIDLPENQNGSGVIVAKRGHTYYVLTAKHVVGGEVNYAVVTSDRQRYLVNPRNVKELPGVDLAVVQFESEKNYQVATLARYNLVNSDRFVFVSGWPASIPGSKSNHSWILTLGILNSPQKALFLAKDSSSSTNGYELVYDNITAGGMSGGPVLDIRGRVIGIHGRADGEIQLGKAGQARLIQLDYSFGIPIRTFLSLVSQVGIEPDLQVDVTAPLLRNRQEIELILSNLLPVGEIPKDSTDAVEWLNYGNQLWRLSKYSEALQAFDRAIQLRPNFYQAWYVKGLVWGAQEKYIEGFACFERATQIKDNFAPAWRRQSQILLLLGRPAESLIAINKALQIEPNDYTLQLVQAVSLAQLHRDAEARDTLNEVIKTHPFSFAYEIRASVDLKLKDYQQALADSNEAIRLQPDLTHAYYDRSNARLALGDQVGAIADLDQMIRLAPDSSNAYTDRAQLRAALGDNQGAIADYTQGIHHLNATNNDAVYASAVYGLRAIAYYKLGDKPMAIADWTESIRLNPKLAGTYFLRGGTREQLGDRLGAFADFTQTIRIVPNYAIAYMYRGRLRFNLGDKQGALADLQQAADLAQQQRNTALYQQVQQVKANLIPLSSTER